jgi:transcriptional regulator with PAS, ATPase and Fis domain
VINRRTRHADVGETQGSLRDVERAYVQRVLAESSTLAEAARHLAIDQSTLWRKRKQWRLA